MDDPYPESVLTASEITLLEEAAQLINKAKDVKEDPSQLRLILTDIAANRFIIGHKKAKYAGHARVKTREAYNINRLQKMSPNAAYKQAEMDEMVIKYKNARDLMETAYEVMQSFVSTNQTSLGIAKEEAKNNL